MKETISKTREYLNYIERHYDNVQKAFNEVTEKLSKVEGSLINDDAIYYLLKGEVENHDLSKLGVQEFVQYRRKFFSTKEELRNSDPEIIKEDFNRAWEHHYLNNDHHWEYINSSWSSEGETLGNKVRIIHMVIDWTAMGYEFGDNARLYYEANRDKIELLPSCRKYLNEVLDAVVPKPKEKLSNTFESAIVDKILKHLPKSEVMTSADRICGVIGKSSLTFTVYRKSLGELKIYDKGRLVYDGYIENADDVVTIVNSIVTKSLFKNNYL